MYGYDGNETENETNRKRKVVPRKKNARLETGSKSKEIFTNAM